MKWLLMIILKGAIPVPISYLVSFYTFAATAVFLFAFVFLARFDVDLKLGISEKSIFEEFHPDAQDLFNVTCDLKFVCEKLNDRSQRHKRQVIALSSFYRTFASHNLTLHVQHCNPRKILCCQKLFSLTVFCVLVFLVGLSICIYIDMYHS
jgi:hypothetical protein